MDKIELLERLVELFPCTPYKGEKIIINTICLINDTRGIIYFGTTHRIDIMCELRTHIRVWINRLCFFINVRPHDIILRYE